MIFFDVAFVLLRLFLLRNASDADSDGNGINSRKHYTPGDYLVADDYRWDSNNLSAIPFKDSDYYISVNPTTWNMAEDDCIKVFKSKGKVGGLVVIETEAERKKLNLMLERFGSGKKYWTSVIWEGKSWLWGNGEKVPGFLLPASDSRPTIQDRLILDYYNRFNSELDIRSDTEPHRYICEAVHDPSEDDGCGDKPCVTTTTTTTRRPDPGPCGGYTCPTPPPPPPNPCHSYSSSVTQCMACPGCAYCGHPSYTGPRCDTRDTIEGNCGSQFVCDSFDSRTHTMPKAAAIIRYQASNGRESSPRFYFCPGNTRQLSIGYALQGYAQIGINHQQSPDSQISGVDRMNVWFYSSCRGSLVETKICPGGHAQFTVKMTMPQNGCQGLNSPKNLGLIIRPQFYPTNYDFTIPYTLIC